LSDASRGQVDDTSYVVLLARGKQSVSAVHMHRPRGIAAAALKNSGAIDDGVDAFQCRRPVGGTGARHVDGKVSSRLRMLIAGNGNNLLAGCGETADQG
jgi:hypothetical protein